MYGQHRRTRWRGLSNGILAAWAFGAVDGVGGAEELLHSTELCQDISAGVKVNLLDVILSSLFLSAKQKIWKRGGVFFTFKNKRKIKLKT